MLKIYNKCNSLDTYKSTSFKFYKTKQTKHDTILCRNHLSNLFDYDEAISIFCLFVHTTYKEVCNTFFHKYSHDFVLMFLS